MLSTGSDLVGSWNGMRFIIQSYEIHEIGVGTPPSTNPDGSLIIDCGMTPPLKLEFKSRPMYANLVWFGGGELSDVHRSYWIIIVMASADQHQLAKAECPLCEI